MALTAGSIGIFRRFSAPPHPPGHRETSRYRGRRHTLMVRCLDQVVDLGEPENDRDRRKDSDHSACNRSWSQGPSSVLSPTPGRALEHAPACLPSYRKIRRSGLSLLRCSVSTRGLSAIPRTGLAPEIAQGFGLTRNFLKERNSRLYCAIALSVDEDKGLATVPDPNEMQRACDTITLVFYNPVADRQIPDLTSPFRDFNELCV